MRGSRVGGLGIRTPQPLQNLKAIGFLRNTGPGFLQNHKATQQAFNVGPPSAHLDWWWLDFSYIAGCIMNSGTGPHQEVNKTPLPSV